MDRAQPVPLINAKFMIACGAHAVKKRTQQGLAPLSPQAALGGRGRALCGTTLTRIGAKNE